MQSAPHRASANVAFAPLWRPSVHPATSRHPIREIKQRDRSCVVRAAVQQESPGVAEAAASGASAGPLNFELACPICQTTPLRVRQQRGGRPTGDLHCPRCARTFATTSSYVDLTLTSGVEQPTFRAPRVNSQELFRTPLVSFAYERGWRQGFAWAGFPGADREFEMALEFLRPAFGEVLVDMSCGSGLFSRRFLASRRFAGVVAADFSESMLQQTKQYMQQDAALQEQQGGNYLLLRADVGRLPFATGSVAALHAGAAIHCWPNPQAALAEVSRVLRPGGVFVASTFLKFTAPLGDLLGDDVVRPLGQLDPMNSNSSMRYWDEAELRDLCTAVGLQDFRRNRSNRFIMFAATKPTSPW